MSEPVTIFVNIRVECRSCYAEQDFHGARDAAELVVEKFFRDHTNCRSVFLKEAAQAAIAAATKVRGR